MTVYPAGPPGHPPTHPGEMLREDVLPALNLTVKDAADKLGISRQTPHAIPSGRAAVTAEIAVRLGKFRGSGPAIWLNMQSKQDLWIAQQDMRAIIAHIPTMAA